MKRYNITAPIPSEGRIIIDEADNGEWCRYEDVTDTELFKALTAERDDVLQELDLAKRRVRNLLVELTNERANYAFYKVAAQRATNIETHRDGIVDELRRIKKAFDEYQAAPSYANWQEKQKLHSLLGMIK